MSKNEMVEALEAMKKMAEELEPADLFAYAAVRAGHPGLGLVKMLYRGEETTIIAIIESDRDGEGRAEVRPLYIRITPQMAADLRDADGSVPPAVAPESPVANGKQVH